MGQGIRIIARYGRSASRAVRTGHFESARSPCLMPRPACIRSFPVREVDAGKQEERSIRSCIGQRPQAEVACRHLSTPAAEQGCNRPDLIRIPYCEPWPRAHDTQCGPRRTRPCLLHPATAQSQRRRQWQRNSIAPELKESYIVVKRRARTPGRRIVAQSGISPDWFRRFEAQAIYVGSAYHKRRPEDYGFDPPASPRPNKSLCDGNTRLRHSEAWALFRQGLRRGMISRVDEYGLPKYVWAVDRDGRVFEAIRSRGSTKYHGYELGDDDRPMKKIVKKAWRSRCPVT